MSKRDHRLYVEDILESVRAVESYVEGIDFDTFINDRKTYSATLREYIIIGEATGSIIDLLEERFPDYEWRMVKDFRNFIVHEYFGVDPRIVWDLTIQELPILKEKLLLLN
jgi:uncharacterized protein with HEPN domain